MLETVAAWLESNLMKYSLNNLVFKVGLPQEYQTKKSISLWADSEKLGGFVILWETGELDTDIVEYNATIGEESCYETFELMDVEMIIQKIEDFLKKVTEIQLRIVA